VLDEIEAYARELSWILHQICVSLDGLTASQPTWRPPASANSAYAIASHVVGSTNVYALEFGYGQDVSRNRATEFVASGTDAGGLIAAIRQLQTKIGVALWSLKVAIAHRSGGIRFAPSTKTRNEIMNSTTTLFPNDTNTTGGHHACGSRRRQSAS
jgi:hypothetical protein